MIKEREPALERISVVIQVIWTVICYYFIIWISGIVSINNFFEIKEHLIIVFIMIPAWFTLFEFFELGKMERMQRYRNILKKYFIAISFGSFIFLFLAQLFDYQMFSANLILQFAILNFFVLSTQKISGRMILKHFRKRGYNARIILIIADESASSFIRQIIETPEWGYRIWGIVTDSELVKKEFGKEFYIYPGNSDFPRLLDESIIDEVFFCKDEFNTSSVNKFIDACREIGVSFHLHGNALAFKGLIPRPSFVNKQLFLSFINTPDNYYALIIKGAIDFFMAVTVLILVSPIMLIIGLLIKLEDGGPVLFKQVRIGRQGRLFKCIKFRTMVVNAEELKEKLMEQNEQDGPAFKMKNDPRITRVGKFLRKTSLDELPQFINVLMGDMSVVGPRPPIPSEVKKYERYLNRRLSVNPGITCIWQVSGRNNVPFEKWMEMDMQYIDNWSLGLDFIIMLKTITVIFNGNGQ
ncbi:MAG: sugar transferase [Prolixibacteraceae bacterium]|jgi:exopolysaccharide biosynthesis polyprenyl glycosylphosphotransferase|nr:sugar transferase [Prolixibacteraceae bacterium]MDD4755010.1 sugar transferase [Prolixibacteraceae bacterium]NLO00740.1 sugar transferase [Bacteroidales bacterium]